MLSIILPTHNRGILLKNTLVSISNQSLGANEFEVLVVDNASTDNTKEVINSFVASFAGQNIRYIYEPEPGLLSGRHRGASEAEGDILVFIDDDIEADKGWLQAIKDTFDDPKVQLVGGRNLPKYEIEPPEWLQWFCYPHLLGWVCGDLSISDFGEKARQINANDVWGLNFSIRKSAIFELGGFHPDIVPAHLQYLQGDGETGLTIKATQRGYKAMYQPKALVHHVIPANRMTYEAFEKKRFYQGVCNSYTEIRKKHGKYYVKRSTIERTIERLTRFQKKLANTFSDEERELRERLIREKDKNQRLSCPEKKQLKERLVQVYNDGYKFHQESVSKKPELLKWVLRDDYWDYKLPKTTLRT